MEISCILLTTAKRLNWLDTSLRSRWFFEFPSVFINKTMLTILTDGHQIHNNQIESELTSRYFSNNFENEYFKASICKPSIKDVCNLLLNNTRVDFWIERLE